MVKRVARKRRWLRKCDRAPDPTPLEIQRRAALVRASWSELTRMNRAGRTPEDLAYDIPRVTYAAPARARRG